MPQVPRTVTWRDVKEEITRLTKQTPAPSAGDDGIATTAFLQLLEDLWSKCSLNFDPANSDDDAKKTQKQSLRNIISPHCSTVLDAITTHCANNPTLTRTQVTTLFKTITDEITQLSTQIPTWTLCTEERKLLRSFSALCATLNSTVTSPKISDAVLLSRCQNIVTPPSINLAGMLNPNDPLAILRKPKKGDKPKESPSSAVSSGVSSLTQTQKTTQITDLKKQTAELQAKQAREQQLREEAEERARSAEDEVRRLREEMERMQAQFRQAQLDASKHDATPDYDDDDDDDDDDDELSASSKSATEEINDYDGLMSSEGPRPEDVFDAESEQSLQDRINSAFASFAEQYPAVGVWGRWVSATYAHVHFAPLTSRAKMEEEGLTSCDGNAPIGNLVRLATLVQNENDPDDKLKRALLAQSLYALNQYQSTLHPDWLKAYRALIDIAAIATGVAITPTDAEKEAVDADAVNFFYGFSRSSRSYRFGTVSNC